MTYAWHYIAMALLYIAAGLAHWIYPKIYRRILPPWVPWKTATVLLSGVLEVLLGILLFFPAWAPYALYGIMAMLLALLPVHGYMLRHADRFPKIPYALLWVRIPLQGVLIAWAWSYL